jgi:RNA polymerase sigma-70 factor (ECF subfamily)
VTFNPAKARLTTWLHRIAHNRCVDVLRKRKREVSLDSDEPQREASAPAPSALAQPSIDAELRRLPESQRTALVLTYYQNLSNREVAEIMNSSVRAVESLLVRARGNLKKQLEAQQ